jgi:hypothetical protein
VPSILLELPAVLFIKAFSYNPIASTGRLGPSAVLVVTVGSAGDIWPYLTSQLALPKSHAQKSSDISISLPTQVSAGGHDPTAHNPVCGCTCFDIAVLPTQAGYVLR